MFSPTFTGSSSLHRAHTYDLFRARRSSVFIIYQSAPLFHSMGAPSPLLRTRASRLIAPVMGPTAPSQPLPLGLSRCLSAPRPPAPGGGLRKTLHTRGLDHLPSVDRIVNPTTTPLPHLLQQVFLGRLYPPAGFSLQSVRQSDPQVSMVRPPTPPRGAPVAPAECTEGWAPRLHHLPLPRVVPLDSQAGFGLQTLCRFKLYPPVLDGSF